MKKLTTAIMAVVFAVLAAVGVSQSPALASVYWNTTNCNHATIQKYICFDASAGSVTINHGGGAMSGYQAYASFNPTKGAIATDTECNSVNGVTTFPTTGAYGFPTTVKFVDSTPSSPPVPGAVHVMSGGGAYVSWYANSQSGYACFVVP